MANSLFAKAPFEQVKRALAPHGSVPGAFKTLSYCGNDGGPIIIIVHGVIIIIHNPFGPIPLPDPDNPIYFEAVQELQLNNSTFSIGAKDKVQAILEAQRVPQKDIQIITQMAK